MYGHGDSDPGQLARRGGDLATRRKLEFYARLGFARTHDEFEGARGRGVSSVKVDCFRILCGVSEPSESLFSPRVQGLQPKSCEWAPLGFAPDRRNGNLRGHGSALRLAGRAK